MNLETTLLRQSAMIAAIVAGSLLSAAQDPPKPAPTPSPTPAAPPAATPATPKPEGDPFGEKPELFDDAFRDFGAGKDGDASPDRADGAAQDPTDLFGNAFSMFDDDFFKNGQPFAMQIDPQAFKLGQSGGASTYDSTTMDNGTTKHVHVDIAADGKAKATITKQEPNGDKTEQSFEADSVDALKAQAPELKGAFDGGFGMLKQALIPHDAFGRQPLRHAPNGLRRLPRAPQAPLAPPTIAPQPSGPKLGVQVKAIEADDPLRAHLNLDEGVGLLVETVAAGSLADSLKLERFDVITKINDQSIGEAADVAIALKQAGEAAVEVHVIRGGKPLVLTKGI